MGYSHGTCGHCGNRMQSITVTTCSECNLEFHEDCRDEMKNPHAKKSEWVCDSCWNDEIMPSQERDMLRLLFEHADDTTRYVLPAESVEDLREFMRARGWMDESYRKRQGEESEEDDEEEDEKEKEDEEEDKEKKDEQKEKEKEESVGQKRKSKEEEEQEEFYRLQGEWEAEDGYESPSKRVKGVKGSKGSKSVSIEKI